MYRYLIAAAIAWNLLPSLVYAQEIPFLYGHSGMNTISGIDTTNFGPFPIIVVSEPLFKNGSDVCNVIGSKINNDISMSCVKSVTFVNQSPQDVSCLLEVPTDDTFVTFCN